MNCGFYLLSCLHGLRECFIPFSPRKTIAWMSTIQLMIISAAFGASVFLVAFNKIPPLSITSLVVTIVGLVTSVLGIVASALDNPEIYLAYIILASIITSANFIVLCFFTYTAIIDSMDELNVMKSERFWDKNDGFNVSIGACALAFAIEMTLFLISAYIAIKARSDSLVRIENEEVDALLQAETLSTDSQSHNRSFIEQVESQTRFLNRSQNSGRFSNSIRANSQSSLTQSQRDDDLPL